VTLGRGGNGSIPPVHPSARSRSGVPRAPLGLAALLLVVTLTACGTAPAPTPSSPSPAPPAFPRVEGAVLSTSEPVPGDWRVRIRVPDAGTAYARARDLLTAGGYHLTNDQPASDGGSGQACTSARCVTFGALVEPDGGAAVEYEVFPNTGVAG
jgi:hypothetical protein